jgi:dynein assembly factor with WDR repeat domains 1
VVTALLAKEPMLSDNRRPLLLQLVQKLQMKLNEDASQSEFKLKKVVRDAHVLPLTNCAFNKPGDRFITGSYDQTCKVWDTFTGEQLLSLEGHEGVVYALAFNNPFGDTIMTGSFDRTAKLWNASTGTHQMMLESSRFSKRLQSLRFLQLSVASG